MSFTGTDYTWGGGTASQNPNITVQQANPLLALNGTETGGEYMEIQEVAGDLYIASNALFNGTNWVQSDATKASYALRFRSNGSIMERVTAPSAAPTPIVWTTVFSISTAGNTVVSGTLNVTGATTLAGVNVGGAVTGATTIAMTGALSGGTTANFSGVGTFAGVAAGGAVTGATSITMSGALSGGTATFTSPLPLGSGGIGATTLAGANIAVNNANNNFSAAQTVTGVVTGSSFTASTGGITLAGGGGIMVGGGASIYDNGGNTYFANNGRTVNNTLLPDAGGITLLRGGLTIQSTTITTGAGAPTATTPNGSLYLRTDGAANTRLYISEGGGVWAAVSSA